MGGLGGERGRWSRQGGGRKVRQEGLKKLSVCFAHELFESQSMLSRAELQNAMDAPKDLYILYVFCCLCYGLPKVSRRCGL